MILHPGILALLLGALLSLVLLTMAAPLAIRVLRCWDSGSSSELQLRLERLTYLVSTLVSYACGFQLIAVLLYVYTADNLHAQFVGAMCATGTLNANPVGWDLLVLKIVIFFAAGLWLVLNSITRRAPDYPLTRLKYSLLLGLWPLAMLDLAWLLSFFLGLEPQVITSCCGSLFSASGSGVASSLTELPVRPMMVTFFSSAAVMLGLLVAMLRWKAAWLRVATAFAGLAFLVIALIAMVSFISVYIYELPTHHCPFDIFQAGYNAVGYPIYLGLFGGVFGSMIPCLYLLLTRVPSLRPLVAESERTWIGLALCGLILFLLLAVWPVVTGPFQLLNYV